ncbi:MAG: hypothetical protein MI892_04520 [Desulfobacterales bacterium]|nr:hypothetical protein [Desulfobacterales bacterium]
MFYLLEAVPLTIFLSYIRQIDPSVPTAWKGPFLLSGLLAIAIIIFLSFKKHLLNRIFLGVNLYLITGGLAFITGQFWLNQLYGQLQASGMLIWVLVTGVFSLALSPAGFIGTLPPYRNLKQIRIYSLYLLGVTLAAIILSFYFRGNHLLSGTIPFIILFVVQSGLRGKCTHTEENSDGESTNSRM